MNRQDLAARIRAILNKTTEKGCTEAEAASAAAMAKRLLDQHQFDMSELELEEEGCSQYNSPNPLKRGEYDIRSRLCFAIKEFCEVRSWVVGSGQETVFYGLQSDVEFASWLLDSLTNFVQLEADRYKLGKLVDQLDVDGTLYVPPHLEMNAFRAGCIDKIKERLSFEAAKRRQTMQGSHNAVLVIKNALVTREFNKLGLRFGSASLRGSQSGGAAYSAGKAAGDRASFGRPINGGRSTLKIGRS